MPISGVTEDAPSFPVSQLKGFRSLVGKRQHETSTRLVKKLRVFAALASRMGRKVVDLHNMRTCNDVLLNIFTASAGKVCCRLEIFIESARGMFWPSKRVDLSVNCSGFVHLLIQILLIRSQSRRTSKAVNQEVIKEF